MTANDLLIELFIKINDEIELILSDSENEELLNEFLLDGLDIDSYKEKSGVYLEAINILVNDNKPVKLFLRKLLRFLVKLRDFEEDFEITNETFKYCGVKKEVFNDIYIEDRTLTNIILSRHNVIVASTSYSSFERYIEAESFGTLFFVAKALSDNFNADVSAFDRIVFLTNISDNEIAEYYDNKDKLTSYIKLCILSEGLTFHKHFNSNNVINETVLSSNRIKDFTQYNEIFYILSEYNNSKNDLLNKYFLLYTIIENFMYRKPIAKMLGETGKFSIRDFKRFYNEIDSNELKKMNHLFFEIFEIEINGNKIYNHIRDELTNFKNDSENDENELVIFLKKIGSLNSDSISNRSGNIENSRLKGSNKDPGLFVRTVYQLRNSILHNTATEFHLTHYELSRSGVIVNFLHNFMIPTLEKIILHLIFTNHELIFYDRNAMLLYGEKCIDNEAE